MEPTNRSHPKFTFHARKLNNTHKLILRYIYVINKNFRFFVCRISRIFKNFQKFVANTNESCLISQWHGTRLIPLWDMMLCVTRQLTICDMTHDHVWHDSWLCVTCLMTVCDMTRCDSIHSRKLYIWAQIYCDMYGLSTCKKYIQIDVRISRVCKLYILAQIYCDMHDVPLMLRQVWWCVNSIMSRHVTCSHESGHM